MTPFWTLLTHDKYGPLFVIDKVTIFHSLPDSIIVTGPGSLFVSQFWSSSTQRGFLSSDRRSDGTSEQSKTAEFAYKYRQEFQHRIYLRTPFMLSCGSHPRISFETFNRHVAKSLRDRDRSTTVLKPFFIPLESIWPTNQAYSISMNRSTYP